MNKTELITITAENSGLSKKDAERVLNAAIDAITASLAVSYTHLTLPTSGWV